MIDELWLKIESNPAGHLYSPSTRLLFNRISCVTNLLAAPCGTDSFPLQTARSSPHPSPIGPSHLLFLCFWKVPMSSEFRLVRRNHAEKPKAMRSRPLSPRDLLFSTPLVPMLPRSSACRLFCATVRSQKPVDSLRTIPRGNQDFGGCPFGTWGCLFFEGTLFRVVLKENQLETNHFGGTFL